MSIILDEEDHEQTETIMRRVRCADVIMVCQEAQLRQVEEVLGCEDAVGQRYGDERE